MSLTVDGVSKSYGSRTVVDDVSFDVIGGRLTGFVGATGAGKTTTMRIMLGVLRPDTGDVRMDGVPMNTEDRRRFGYMPEERGLYPKMRVLEQLVYLLHSRRGGGRAARDRTGRPARPARGIHRLVRAVLRRGVRAHRGPLRGSCGAGVAPGGRRERHRSGDVSADHPLLPHHLLQRRRERPPDHVVRPVLGADRHGRADLHGIRLVVGALPVPGRDHREHSRGCLTGRPGLRQLPAAHRIARPPRRGALRQECLTDPGS
ncbi:ATP-binding cassette domain-containing protein [Rathayibacter tanaceti]|uniref:ATP-binding cassette domain-containing protein n=1 Tax=Rathayibacter tanaceti TaxID=1671680 RepID=A0AAE6RLK7_9MICO|nr:ATP-binding cassette domain-containing protein [Rathayibacter tanaceti]